MLSAKNEKNAIGATLLFNFAHYALRPWPWIIIAMASLIIYPDLDAFTVKFLIEITGTTLVWLVTTFITRPESMETLYDFFRKTHPGGPGWKKVIRQAESEGKNINEKEAGKSCEMPQQLLMVFFGIIVIYGSLFSIGSFVYGNQVTACITAVIAVAGTFILFRLLDKLRVDNSD